MFAGKHFQNAYVCDDIEAAIEAFKAAGLQKEPRIMHSNSPADTPEGKKSIEMKVAIFRLNGLTYEIIQPINDETGVYANAPDNGGAVRFHHTCCRVDDWEALARRRGKLGIPGGHGVRPWRGSGESRLSRCPRKARSLYRVHMDAGIDVAGMMHSERGRG
jgi:hypothetical protein